MTLLRAIRRAAFGVVALLSAATASAQSPPLALLERDGEVVTITQVERKTEAGAWERAQLPDDAQTPLGAPFVERMYRFELALHGTPSGRAVYLSGVLGHIRMAIDGQLVLDTIADPLPPPPRGANRLRLIDLPPHLLSGKDGPHRVEITLRGQRVVSLSRIAVGAREPLREARDSKALWQVYAPGVVAAMMVCLGLSVLLIWLRRPVESLYAYFAVAAIAWGLHTAWTVSPRALVGLRHYSVWWSTLYYFVVVVLTVFCVRFAGCRFERGAHWLLASVALVPMLLYGTQGTLAHEPMHEAIRLSMVGIATAGLVAVARQAFRHRSIDSALLLFAAMVATALGLRDWLVFRLQDDNLPLQLTPFAGLPFVVLVAWILIDRFVGATESVEGLNRELELRVQHKSAELVSALDHMRAAKEWAEKANRGKTGFLAAASHDLRQPIHALGLYMGALRPRLRGAAEREIVERMDSSIGALESLLDSLLDISRIDAGALVPRPAAFDLTALLRRLGDEFAADAAARGLRLSTRIGGSGLALVEADPLLVERLLRNLVANAVKYTRRGGVLISARPRGCAWRVEVWDTGPGIAPEEHERVFDEFYQAGNQERDRRAGFGLGLSIVRRLAQLMKLPLKLHSVPGRGTRLELTLPRTEALPQVPTVLADELPMRGLRVAVIEDDAEVRGAMRALLGGWGCQVFCGADADEVNRRLDGGPPHALVADLRLRGNRDGIGESQRLRGMVGADFPVLLVSGDTDPVRVRLMETSGLPWLAKPVAASRLRAWLAQARLAVGDGDSAAAVRS